MGVWAILVGCIVGEVIAMSLLTKSEGFTQPLYGILSLVIYAGSSGRCLTSSPNYRMGVVYAVWSGMGIALICITGWAVLQQPLTSVQVLCIALIIGGAIGLSLSTPAFSQGTLISLWRPPVEGLPLVPPATTTTDRCAARRRLQDGLDTQTLAYVYGHADQ